MTPSWRLPGWVRGGDATRPGPGGDGPPGGRHALAGDARGAATRPLRRESLRTSAIAIMGVRPGRDQRKPELALSAGRFGDRSKAEIASLVEELDGRSRRRRTRSRCTANSGTCAAGPRRPGQRAWDGSVDCGSPGDPYRIEVARPGILDLLHACSVARTPPGPKEVEIEVAATGLELHGFDVGHGNASPGGDGGRF